MVNAKGDYSLKQAMNTRRDQSLGALNTLLFKDLVPKELEVRLPYFSVSTVRKGGTHSMRGLCRSATAKEKTPSGGG